MTDKILRENLTSLMRGGSAHIDFNSAVKGIPEELRGRRPPKSPHSPWELIEHMRLAQWDILEFSRSAEHKSPEWPQGYWPQSPAPSSASAWAKSLRQFRADLESMCALVNDPATDLGARIPHGDGQTILREALLVADHNSYHIGQLVLVRRLLGAWK